MTSDLLVEYVERLEWEGFLPDRGNPDDSPQEVERVRLDLEEEDHTDVRHNEATFYQWGSEPWDLEVSRPRDRDMQVSNEARRLAMDHGRAQRWKNLPDGLPKKRSKLISERIGLTKQMLGINSIICDALEPYKMLVERLQISTFPIGHNVRRWISQCFVETNTMFLIPDAEFGPQFQKWRAQVDVSDDLIQQVKKMGRQFVWQFLSNARHRLQPYWSVILAMETIIPCAPHRQSPAAWRGVLDLCKRVGMDDEHARKVVRDLKSQQSDAAYWSLAEVKACTNNLLRYYHDRLQADMEDNKQPDYPFANCFAALIFSLHLASAIIESYFSKTKYIKNQYRSRLSDALASATLHLQQLRAYHDVQVLEPSSSMSMDFREALTYVENNLDDLRKKYLGARVMKPFFDEDQDATRDFGGDVVSVDWSAPEGCYLFRVTYDSDSDDEDMEYWELKKYLIR